MSTAPRLASLALFGATAGLGCWLLVALLRAGTGRRPDDGRAPASPSAARRRATSGAVVPIGVGGVLGLAAGVVVGVPVLTMLGGGVGWLVAEARRGPSVDEQNELGDAIASWCETLRQELDAGQPLKTAVAVSCAASPPALTDPLRRLRARLDRQALPAALAGFRQDVAHPAVGAIVTALVLTYQHGAGELAMLMADQVEVTRHRVAVLRDTHAARARHRRAMTLLLALFALSTLGVLVVWPAMLGPYRTAPGQAILVVIVGVVGYAVRTLLRLSRPDETPDFFGGAR
ncbi:hypothetical protein [Parafrankia sp. EUN1f]|uniref:hypothetical protein n=1 Tax=Parafrankia sp. EUN1f TaxID=102897 RepID=UPI0001C45204|nr:hypothetical protein [Parafrankia sp. EUN1f]EFC82847.1 hypothetical protein FrEUN1fDRAFT_4044 [Parafrankia sp. EUN1f]